MINPFNFDFDQFVIDTALSYADLKWKKELDPEWIQVFNDKPLYYLDGNLRPAKLKNIYYCDRKIIRVFSSPSTYTDTPINPRVTISLGSGIIFFDNIEDAGRFSDLYKADNFISNFEQNERTFAMKSEGVTSWKITDNDRKRLEKLGIDGLYSLEEYDMMINMKNYYSSLIYVDLDNDCASDRPIQITLVDRAIDEKLQEVLQFIDKHSIVNGSRIGQRRTTDDGAVYYDKGRIDPSNGKLLFEIALVGNTVYVCDYYIRIPPHGVITSMLINNILHGWKLFRSASDALEYCKRYVLTGNRMIHLEDQKYKNKQYVDYCETRNKTYRNVTAVTTRVCLFVFNSAIKNKMLAVINKKKDKILDKMKRRPVPKPENDHISEGDIISLLNETPNPIMMSEIKAS